MHDGQRAILREVVLHGARSRADLARRTGFSRQSLARLTRDLVDLEFIVDGEERLQRGLGRPSEVVRIRPESARFAGIKLTGDALYAVVTDLHAHVIDRVEHPLPSSKSPSEVVELISDVIVGFRARHERLAAVGVCLAGDIEDVDGSADVVDSIFLGWDRVPLQLMVEQATSLPAVISNDVQALTIGHHWFGAGVGSSSLAVISFGAGIGAGLVVHGELVRGARGHPGKIGHILVSSTDSGPVCEQGHRGCVSSWVTVPAVIANAQAVDLADAIARSDEGDVRAREAVRGGARALGAIVAYLIDLVDPETVIVTGEGLPIARAASDSFSQGLAGRLDPASSTSVPVTFWDFDFADYAWAASIAALRRVLQPLDTSQSQPDHHSSKQREYMS